MAMAKVVKRGYKLLAEGKVYRVRNAIIEGAPPKLVKTICTPVLNIERGFIAVNERQKKALKKDRNPISKLTSRSLSLC